MRLDRLPSPERLAEAHGREADAVENGFEHPAAAPLGDMAILFEAVGVSWRGKRLPLSGAEARIVAYVLERGRASWDELNQVTGREGCAASTLRVFLWRLRHKLVRAGAPDLIRTERGWGVVLKTGRAAAAARPVEGAVIRDRRLHAGC